MLAIFQKNKGIFLYITILSLDRFVGLCLIYYLVRLISDEYFTYWTQVNFLSTTLSGILGLGLSRGVLLLLVEDKYKKKVVRYILITLCIILILISSFSYFITLFINDPNLNTFLGGETYPFRGSLFLLLFINLEGFFDILINYLRAKFSNKFLFFIALRIIPRILIVLLILVLQLDFWLSFTIYFCFTALICLSLFFSVFKIVNEENKNDFFSLEEYVSLLKNIFKYSLPLTISCLALPIFNIFIRSHLSEAESYDQLGILSIYISFIGMLAYFPEVIQSYIFPRLVQMSKRRENRNKEMYYRIGPSIVFSLFFCLIFSLIGVYILELVYPKKEWVLIDCIFISVTAFLWTLHASFEKLLLIFFSFKNQFLIFVYFLSFVFGYLILYSNFLSGPLNSILGLLSYFLISSFLQVLLFKFLSYKKN
jgi:O-antigen/teichoic acid export membrane protein